MSGKSVIQLAPLTYIWVLDQNYNITRVEQGPLTFTRKEHETVVDGPKKMIVVPPRYFCRIKNPKVVVDGEAQKDKWGNTKLRYGEEEIRGHMPPFPLYPGEVLSGAPTKLAVLQPDTALKLVAIADFVDEAAGGVQRKAGDEWLQKGPGTYFPTVHAKVVELVKARLIRANQALRLRARFNFEDGDEKRIAGQEWLVREPQMYLPRVEEEVVAMVEGTVLTRTTAVRVQALRNFVDYFKVARKAGEQWLVTNEMCDVYIPDVHETLKGTVNITSLSTKQYCVVVNVLDPKTKEPRLGHRELRKGPQAFFLNPGETLERGIQDTYVLSADETLLLQAVDSFVDAETKKEYAAGSQWLIRGPQEYIPPVEVEVKAKRNVIPLAKDEGIYVRDLKTGEVRAVVGTPHLLQANEALWQKELPKAVEELVALGAGTRDQSQRDNVVSVRTDKTRVVSFSVPYNAATQVYDYKEKRSRIVFGPELVLLGPYEEFTLLSLSGGNPKRKDEIRSLCLFLGPDFMTDIVIVETGDHARLSLKLAYNWVFDVDRSTQESAARIFQVADFVGDACSAIASKVRGAVAAVSFDAFHKDSANIIRSAVFAEGEDALRFKANGLVVTGIDVQSVEPIDGRTRDELQKSVQMAIEITSRSQEAAAKHIAEKNTQKALGELQIMEIDDNCAAEKLKTELLKLHTKTAIIEAIGDHTSDAEAKKRAAEIEGKAAVRTATIASEAVKAKVEGELEVFRLKRELQLEVKKKEVELEIERARRLAAIEAEKFSAVVSSIGADTIKAIAQAGPEMQAQLLEGLGLQGYLMTDGNSPINLFDASSNMLGGGSSA